MTEAPPLIGRHRMGPRGLPLGKKAAEMKADEDAFRDSQPILTLCGLCEWRFEGLVGEGREAARAHRESEHPEATVRRPRRSRQLKSKRQRSPEEEAQAAVDVAEARRSRQERAISGSGRAVPSSDPERAAVSSSTGYTPRPGSAAEFIISRLAAGEVRYADLVGRHSAGLIGATLNFLVRRGVVRRVEKGVYVLASDPAPTPVRAKPAETWTQAKIVEAIARWAAEHDGVPPSSDEWKPAPAGYPAKNTVIKKFGSWSAAIAAAGFAPCKPGLRRSERSGREPQAEPERPAGVHSLDADTPSSVSSRPGVLEQMRRYLELRRDLDRMETELLAALEEELAA